MGREVQISVLPEDVEGLLRGTYPLAQPSMSMGSSQNLCWQFKAYLEPQR